MSDEGSDSLRLMQLESTPAEYLTKQQKKELKKLQKARKAGCLKMGVGHPTVISIHDPPKVKENDKTHDKKKKKVSKGKQGFCFNGGR